MESFFLFKVVKDIYLSGTPRSDYNWILQLFQTLENSGREINS